MAVTIPRVIHQVWLGPNPFPDRFAAFQAGWRHHHPDWEFRFWTEKTLPGELRCSAIAERMRDPVERCDLMRLEVLWREGGVYVDCDFECRRPIDALLEGTGFFVAYIGPNRVNHALMGAVAGHPILDRALDEVRPRLFFGYDKEATGPAFFNRLLAEYPDATIYPAEFFYPNTEEDRERAYAVHHAERSWQDRETMKKTLDKAYRRLERTERTLAAREVSISKLKTLASERKAEIQELQAQVARLNKDLELRRRRGLRARLRHVFTRRAVSAIRRGVAAVRR